MALDNKLKHDIEREKIDSIKTLLESALTHVTKNGIDFSYFDPQEQEYLAARFDLTRHGKIKMITTKTPNEIKARLSQAENALKNKYDEEFKKEFKEFQETEKEAFIEAEKNFYKFEEAETKAFKKVFKKEFDEFRKTEKEAFIEGERNYVEFEEVERKATKDAERKAAKQARFLTIGVASGVAFATAAVLGPLAGFGMVGLELALGIIAAVTVVAGAAVATSEILYSKSQETTTKPAATSSKEEGKVKAVKARKSDALKGSKSKAKHEKVEKELKEEEGHKDAQKPQGPTG